LIRERAKPFPLNPLPLSIYIQIKNLGEDLREGFALP
jgi:hypothetical protein